MEAPRGSARCASNAPTAIVRERLEPSISTLIAEAGLLPVRALLLIR
jgi:hypothetical protein